MPCRRLWLSLCIALAAAPMAMAADLLPMLPETYIRQADAVRRAHDRPWAPEDGQLGNLRHLQILAPDCVVRVVSGSENRVFPGNGDITVVERSRVLDSDPDEQPAPRDVLLAPAGVDACMGSAPCGVSIARATRAPRVDGAPGVCFTVQLASAHEILFGGDGLTLLVDRVRQPRLRLFLNPQHRMKLWFEDVDIGLLSISANAAAQVGGTGRVDFLQGSSSNGGSAMYLHALDARNIGISSTTTGTQWSIRIDDDTTAGYYQPASAGGAAAKGYPIEIDGDIARLEIPAGRVDPRPLSNAMRDAARALGNDVRARAGPRPALPASDPTLPLAASVAAALPGGARELVAQVVARHLPASVRLTDIALWPGGGRVEGIAPDAATARDVESRLRASGEFASVRGSGISADAKGHAFKVVTTFHCDTPGQITICAAGDPKRPDRYTEMQVIEALETLLAPTATLHDARLQGDMIYVDARAPNEAEARASLERIAQDKRLFRVSASGVGARENGGHWSITVHLRLACAAPPKADGICLLPPPDAATLSDGPE